MGLSLTPWNVCVSMRRMAASLASLLPAWLFLELSFLYASQMPVRSESPIDVALVMFASLVDAVEAPLMVRFAESA